MDGTTAVLIVALSALFPMMGYYLDWRARKKNYQPRKKEDKT